MSRMQALVLVAALAAPGAALLRAQSLAEAARQEVARRKQLKTTARVITNKDLPSVPPATASPPPTGSTQAATPPDGSASPTTSSPGDTTAAAGGAALPAGAEPAKDGANGGARDERYWRDRIGRARAEVEHNQIFADALQSRIDALTTDFVNRDDPAQRAVIATDRQKAIVELDRVKKAIVSGSTAIGDIEEEARRAGAPPGWLR